MIHRKNVTHHLSKSLGRFLLGILSLMVIVFSCPVKKVLAQNENVVGTTTSHKAKHEVFSLEAATEISTLATDCCLHKSDEKSISQQTVSVDQPSFDLSGLVFSITPTRAPKNDAFPLDVPVLSNFRPLFLQHASLLI